jgi:arylsulfatase A-like enzyme
MPRTPALEKAFRERFAASIAYMDFHFGRLIDGLRQQQLLEDTLIVFTTDHGMSGPRGKSSLYGLGTEIALMLRLPGGEHAGETRDQLITNIDFRPTWTDAAGVDPVNKSDGRSFWQTAADPQAPHHDDLFLCRNFHGQRPFRVEEDYLDLYNPLRAVRSPSYLYIRNYSPFAHPKYPTPDTCVANGSENWGSSWSLPEDPPPPEELYDLENDPYEIRNIAKDPHYRNALLEARKRLETYIRDTNDFIPGLPPVRPCEPTWGENWPVVSS